MNTCTPARQCELYSSQLDFLPRFLQYIMVNHYWNGFTIGWNQLWRRIIIKRDLARALLRMWFVVLSLSLLWSKIQFITTKSWQKHQFLSYSNIMQFQQNLKKIQKIPQQTILKEFPKNPHEFPKTSQKTSNSLHRI